MSPTSILNVHLTTTQAQHAAAFDDLLRQLVFDNGTDWNSLPKTMHKMSYKDRYHETLKECGRKATKCAKVENVERFFETYAYDKKRGTAGMPHPLFKELISVWKTRATADADRWNGVSLHDPEPSIASGSSTSVASATTKSTRVTTVCAVSLKKTDGPMVGLNYVVIALDPLGGLEDYHQAGIDPSRLVLMEKFGDWHMVLGPGSAIRPACVACWNVRAEYMKSPVFITAALLRENIEDREELFVLSCTDKTPCSHPDHEYNIDRQFIRSIPRNTLMSIRSAPTSYPSLPTFLHTKVADRSVSIPQSVPPPSERHISMPPPPEVKPEIIHNLPAVPHAPLRPRKLDPKIHRQVIRARILLGAKRLTARLQQETDVVNAQAQAIKDELEKSKKDAAIAQSYLDCNSATLAAMTHEVQKERTAGKEMKQKMTLLQGSARVAELKLQEVTVAKDTASRQLKEERKKSGQLIKRVSGLEEEAIGLKASLAGLGKEAAAKRGEHKTAQAASGEALKKAREQVELLAAERQRLVKENDRLESGITHLNGEMTKMKNHYDDQLNRQHQHALDSAAAFEARVNQQVRQGSPGATRELDGANARIVELEAQLADADRMTGQAQRELNRVLAAAERARGTPGPPVAGGGGGGVRQPDPAIPRHLQPHMTNTPGPSRHHPSDHRIRPAPYSRASLPLPTPPTTASPTGSHQALSPAYHDVPKSHWVTQPKQE